MTNRADVHRHPAQRQPALRRCQRPGGALRGYQDDTGTLGLSRGAPAERAAAQRLVYCPYKHAPIALGADDVISLAVPGGPVPVAANGRSVLPPGVNVLTLAFAAGECGSETWDGLEPNRITSGNVHAFVRFRHQARAVRGR